MRVKVHSHEHECWRRYRDFLELHRRLAMWDGRPELPPKKAIGHKGKEFVCERRDALEAYLKVRTCMSRVRVSVRDMLEM